jgi:class 3 adenylate cyclase
MERVLCPILIRRDEELSRLEDALLSANRGEGQVVLLAGDAGMGKTRLASELAERAARLGMTALQAAIALRDKAATLGLPVGAGIATGAAVVGALAEGANVSVVGETTNLASRLQAHAEAGEIVLSAETHRRVRDWMAGAGYETVEARLRLKGFKKPVIAQRVRPTGGAEAYR